MAKKKKRVWPACTRCGTILAGCRVCVAHRTARGVTVEVETFACRCGRRRRVTRPG